MSLRRIRMVKKPYPSPASHLGYHYYTFDDPDRRPHLPKWLIPLGITVGILAVLLAYHLVCWAVRKARRSPPPPVAPLQAVAIPADEESVADNGSPLVTSLTSGLEVIVGGAVFVGGGGAAPAPAGGAAPAAEAAPDAAEEIEEKVEEEEDDDMGLISLFG